MITCAHGVPVNRIGDQRTRLDHWFYMPTLTTSGLGYSFKAMVSPRKCSSLREVPCDLRRSYVLSINAHDAALYLSLSNPLLEKSSCCKGLQEISRLCCIVQLDLLRIRLARLGWLFSRYVGEIWRCRLGMCTFALGVFGSSIGRLLPCLGGREIATVIEDKC